MMDDTLKAIQTVINRAWADEHFKQSFIKNPKEIIERMTGVIIPPSVDLVIHDQTNTKKTYLTIPPIPNFDQMELSDEQLDSIAGGEVLTVSAVRLTGARLLTTSGKSIYLD